METPLETIDVDKSVADWAVDHPNSIALFQQYGIDYCCAGKSLAYACGHAGVALPEVVAKLRELMQCDSLR